MPVIDFNPDEDAPPDPYTWREYESDIKGTLASKFPDCSIEADQRIRGYFSKVDRQIDILVTGELVGKPIVGVIECKYFSRKVDVKVVDSFIGFLEDVRANLGIIITNVGYTPAALSRAEVKNIHLDVVSFDHLEDYEPPWDICALCDPGPEKPPALIDWEYPTGDDVPFDVGTCQWCSGFSVKCHDCGSITGVGDWEYDKPVGCEGGCGMVFQVDAGSGSDRWIDYSFELVKAAGAAADEDETEDADEQDEGA